MVPYSGCLMSFIDLCRDILSLAYALKPFTLYNSCFCFSSLASNITACPCSPGPINRNVNTNKKLFATKLRGRHGRDHMVVG